MDAKTCAGDAPGRAATLWGDKPTTCFIVCLLTGAGAAERHLAEGILATFERRRTWSRWTSSGDRSKVNATVASSISVLATQWASTEIGFDPSYDAPTLSLSAGSGDT